MIPYLDIFGFRLSTYALAGVVAYLVAVSVATWQGRRLGISPKRIVDLTFWAVIAAIVGARVGFLFEQLPSYLELCVGADAPAPAGCADFWKPWKGGFVYYGGFVAAALTVAFLARRYRLAFWSVADAIAPALAIAHAIGRVGCFLAGCCYGKATSGACAVRFHDATPGGGIFRHPTQLYEAAAELLIFGALLVHASRRRRSGSTFLLYVALYAVARFVVELFRGDADRGYLFELVWPWLANLLRVPPGEPMLLSVAQAVSAGLLLAAVLVWLVRRHRAVVAGPGRSPTSTSTDSATSA